MTRRRAIALTDLSAAKWNAGPASAALEPDELHIWMTEFAGSTDGLGDLSAALPAAERAIARLLELEEVGRLYSLRRAVTREVIAKYVDDDPSTIDFVPAPRGRERLANHGIRFSSTAREGLVLCAVALAGDVGSALERVTPLEHIDDLVAAFFSPGERRAYDGLDPGERVRFFYSIWAAKEALFTALAPNWAATADAILAPRVAPTELAAIAPLIIRAVARAILFAPNVHDVVGRPAAWRLRENAASEAAGDPATNVTISGASELDAAARAIKPPTEIASSG